MRPNPGIRHGLHALYVAGPGQEAGRVGYQWEDFTPQLFDNIERTDGYAMHVYGYYHLPNCIPNPPNELCGDPDGDLFTDWLDTILDEMDSHASGQSLLITEYNPGDDNIPPNPNLGDGDEWDDWFEQTYRCVQ